MLKIIVQKQAKMPLLLLLCGLLSHTGAAVQIHNATHKPVSVVCIKTVFKLGDRHNKLYVDEEIMTRDEVIDATDVYVIPPGQFITAPSLGERSLTTYDRDLWASYSYDNLARSVLQPAGRNPYKNKVFYYNIGSETLPIYIVENKDKLSFITKSKGNKAKLEELAELVGAPYKDMEPQIYSLGEKKLAPALLQPQPLSEKERKERKNNEKRFNLIMKALAIPYRM